MMLETGYNQSFDIRYETCVIAGDAQFSILYLSDLHLNRFSKKTVDKIIQTIDELKPTIILYGGDYVDSKKGLTLFNELLTAVSHRTDMFAVAGNHDYYFGLDDIKNVFLKHNVTWIEKTSFCFNLQGINITIDGNLISDEQPGDGLSILLLHQPKDIGLFKDNYQLAFAGHLHGSQFVLWQSGEKLYPGKWFYKWNILKMTAGSCRYFISKGLGDTLPIRYNCKKDMIFVSVSGNS